MGEIFSFINIIFVVVIVLIFLRLRQVLGRRTGHERPPAGPFSRREEKEGSAPGNPPARDASRDNVIDIPSAPAARRAAEDDGKTAEDHEKQRRAALDKLVARDSELARNLGAIMTADSSFDADSFLNGARMAYEMIVMAFAEGNRKTLKTHLSAEVFSGFTEAISARESAGQRFETTFIGILKSEFVHASMEGKSARIAVRFESEMITATFDSDDRLVEGDPKKVSTIIDVWTFSRNLTVRDPNWKLVATEFDD